MYRRRFNFRRRYKPRRRYKRRRGGNGLAKKVSYLMKQNKQNRPQLQFTDTVGAAANIDTTPVIVKLNTVADRGVIKSIQLKGSLNLVGAVTTQSYYRIIIFTDKSNEGGALPVWGDIYKSAVGLDAVISLRNLVADQNEGTRFRVIYDKKFKLIKDEDGTTNDVRIIDWYKKLNNRYIDSGAFYESGGLYMAYVGTTGINDADFTYQIRLRWIESTT